MHTKSSSSSSLPHMLSVDSVSTEFEYFLQPTVNTSTSPVRSKIDSEDTVDSDSNTDSNDTLQIYINRSSKSSKILRKPPQETPGILGTIGQLDKKWSYKIHKLSCGSCDILFLFGAFIFGSKFMPITILFSLFILDIAHWLFLGIACMVTVSITQIAKKVIGRLRPEINTLGPKILDLRSPLTNFAFPSGDTAQAAAYCCSLYLLENNFWYLLLIPNCAWARIYFGCHYIGDCIAGALIGIIVVYLFWNILPSSFLDDMQAHIQTWLEYS